jgi:hypothetical protein
MLGIRAQSLRYTVPKSLCSPILFAAVALAPVLVLLAVGHGGVFEGGNLSKNDIRLYLDGAEHADEEERSLGDFLLEELHSFVGESWEQEEDIILLTLRRSADLAIKSATHGWNRRGREIGRPGLHQPDAYAVCELSGVT